MVQSLLAFKIGVNGLSGLTSELSRIGARTGSRNLSFEKILSDTRSSAGLPAIGSSTQSIQGLLNLQRDLYGVHLRVELVSKVADGALSTARRLQQGQ